ncbi:MAG TPA: neutral zinc metallopeptidase [Micromonosporaceae bacterium]|nr:neutral zinc metallopeptidase [Micromonosporaceae bacterium]
MQLNENASIDTSQVEDRRGASGGGGLSGIPIPVGGGKMGLIVTLIVVVVSLVGGGFGINSLTGDESGGGTEALRERCSANDRLEQLDCRNTLYVNSIQDYWRDAMPRHFGRPYQPATTTFFAQAVQTGCGSADSGVGPFYCPADNKVYIDLTFYRTLADQLGAGGEFAQPYVLAHEYGHHVQSVLGTESQMRRAQQRDPDNANRYSVMLELQADCYAGVWAKNATGTDDAQGQQIFTSITQDDIQQGLDTAAAIGDDTLQKRSGGEVNPREFTHGTSQQRQDWFNRGFEAGDPKRCDTFGGAL